MKNRCDISVIMKTPRSISFMLSDGGIYYAKEEYRLTLNGEDYGTMNKTVHSLYNLEPSFDYDLKVINKSDETVANLKFKTEEELLTINVKELGAKGDGIQDDTAFIQAAIMACPAKGRVLIPAGNYLITSIFITSNIYIELEKGANLLGDTKRENRVHFPGSIETTDPSNDEYHLGTWEGNPLPMFAGIISGINASNTVIYGEGVVDGCASKDNWWNNPKVMNIAYRPRMIFLNNCKNIKMQGITVTNSPAWNIHPFFSEDLLFCDLKIYNPKVSPNTDGLDPESCKNVDIVGIHFSLGDDCIAVKSGKIYMGAKYKRPSDNIHVHQCLMENGHGAVTLGSEIAGGITNMTVEECLFNRTDRGLRIKTRRGRGKQCFLNNITFKNIVMDNVMNPFTANMFYYCDPDGHDEYVQSKEMYPVDERTPKLGILKFENIKATNAHVSAGYFSGLPESKIEAVIMKDVSISFAQNTESGVPIMSDSVSEMTRCGIFAENVKLLELENVNIDGAEGDVIKTVSVDRVKSCL